MIQIILSTIKCMRMFTIIMKILFVKYFFSIGTFDMTF